MKFCYIDESGTGSEPISVMVGVIVDTYNMRITKTHWSELLKGLSEITKKKITELHTRDFYAGNGPWRQLDRIQIDKIIDLIIKWLFKRKLNIVYTTVLKNNYYSKKNDKKIKEVGALWQFMALHIALSLQKKYQGAAKENKRKIEPKGDCVLIFDKEDREQKKYINTLLLAPDWTNTYYDKKKGQEKMDKIIDVPHFVDSKQVGLIQLADFICFFLRKHIELSSNLTEPKYEGEKEKIEKWTKLMLKRSIPKSNIYMNKGRCNCADLFYQCAPKIIRNF